MAKYYLTEKGRQARFGLRGFIVKPIAGEVIKFMKRHPYAGYTREKIAQALVRPWMSMKREDQPHLGRAHRANIMDALRKLKSAKFISLR